LNVGSESRSSRKAEKDGAVVELTVEKSSVAGYSSNSKEVRAGS
jgi:hypothetical protein